MKSSTSGSVKWSEWVWKQPIERLNIVSGKSVDLHMWRTKLKVHVYLVSFGRKFITDLIQLIGSTRPKFDALTPPPPGDLNLI